MTDHLSATDSIAKEVFKIEAEGVKNLSNLLDHHFSEVVEHILTCEGKLVFTGMGKAGIIAQKVSSTFSSLGNSAFFMHSADASHGDLGMVGEKDIVFFFSNSGGTKEVVSLIPTIKKIGCVTVALTGKKDSFLYQNVEHPLFIGNLEEACGLGLAPTTSTTVMLAMGDALAVSSLKQRKDFDEKSFAFYHPGGSLGKKLLKVSELMRVGTDIVSVKPNEFVKEVIYQMTQARIGSAVVVNDSNEVEGVFSDGDLRRNLDHEGLMNEPIIKMMTTSPFKITDLEYVEEAIKVMKTYQIGELPVVDSNRKLVGVVCLKDLV